MAERFGMPERQRETADQRKERLMPVFRAALDVFNDQEQPIENARITVTRERANGEMETIADLVVFDINEDGPEMAMIDEHGEPTASATMLWSELVDAKKSNLYIENSPMPENKAETPEHIPSKEEVLAVIKNLAGGQELSERRILEDELGVYVWELEVKTAEGVTEYGYMRKGSHRKGENHGGALTTAIHATLFDADGMPYSGGNVAELVDGEWKLIK